MSDREFKNPYRDHDESSKLYDFDTNKLSEDIEREITTNAGILLRTLEERLKNEVDWSDTSVYTGTSGIALLCIKLMNSKQFSDKKDFLKVAMYYIEPALSNLKGKKHSFLCGDSGPLAIGSVLHNLAGNIKKSQDLAHKLKISVSLCSLDTDTPDELLYGRCGYLYSLLFLQKYGIEVDELNSPIIQVISDILESGKYLAKKRKYSEHTPLFYEWHEKAYVGSAHGFAGILYLLLQARKYLSEDDINELIKPAIEYVLSLQFPSGNFPSSLGNSSDKLVHWCHGAPGVIHLLILSYEIFQDKKYLEAAVKCSNIIWEKGLLKKGYGICHGVAGNGYAHLRMFQLTKDVKYLHRAIKFAEWCFDYGKHGCHIPDRPLSLFEGLAGTIYFLVELLDPLNSAFPAFQLH